MLRPRGTRSVPITPRRGPFWYHRGSSLTRGVPAISTSKLGGRGFCLRTTSRVRMTKVGVQWKRHRRKESSMGAIMSLLLNVGTHRSYMHRTSRRRARLDGWRDTTQVCMYMSGTRHDFWPLGDGLRAPNNTSHKKTCGWGRRHTSNYIRGAWPAIQVAAAKASGHSALSVRNASIYRRVLLCTQSSAEAFDSSSKRSTTSAARTHQESSRTCPALEPGITLISSRRRLHNRPR
jgi:hypothetical protein